MKSASITIKKSLVLYDINALTYKRVDGVMSDQSDKVKNAISSDTEEELDKMLLHRMMEQRDGEIRRKLAFALKGESETLTASNDINDAEPNFIYDLVVPDTFTSASLSALTQNIHRYLVDGCAYDWYRKQGVEYAVGESELEDLEAVIASSLRIGYIKKPLQPFGPAK